MAAASVLFAAHGFDNCTTTDIAKRAGVSQRTLFRYFPNKDDLLMQWLDQHNGMICARLRSRPVNEPDLEALRRALDHYCDLSRDEEAHGRFIHELAESSPTFQGRLLSRQDDWEERIAAALNERRAPRPSDDYRSKFLAGFALSALRIAFRESHAKASAASITHLIDLGFSIIGASVRVEH